MAQIQKKDSHDFEGEIALKSIFFCFVLCVYVFICYLCG